MSLLMNKRRRVRRRVGASRVSRRRSTERRNGSSSSVDGDGDASFSTAIGHVECLLDPSAKMDRTAKYWRLQQKVREDSLARGTRVTVGPTGYRGYARIQSIFRDFRSFFSDGSGAWEIYQTRTFEIMCNCNIKLILGEDIDSCLDYVMWENGWKTIPTHAFILAYRGAGKSALAAGAMATMFANIPNYTLTMYGGPKDKAIDLFETFFAYFRKLMELNPERASTMKVLKRDRRVMVSCGPNDTRWVEIQMSCGNVSRLSHSTLLSADPPTHPTAGTHLPVSPISFSSYGPRDDVSHPHSSPPTRG